MFQAAPEGSKDWREIMSLRQDDPVPIPRNQIRFVNDQIGYIFMVYNYAITTDGGATWFVWNIVEDLPGWHQNRVAIEEVQIAPDGKGVMMLTSFSKQKAPNLYTEDYGRNWSDYSAP